MYICIWYMCVSSVEKDPSIYCFGSKFEPYPSAGGVFSWTAAHWAFAQSWLGPTRAGRLWVMMDARSARCWRGWGGRFWWISSLSTDSQRADGEDKRVKILWMGQRNPAPIRWFISLFVGFQQSKIGGWSDFAGPSTVCKLYIHNADHPVVYKLLDMFFHCKGKQLSCFFVLCTL
jgi:hypothetical protein